MDEFFNKKRCDRCGALLDGGFTMSRFNTDAICMKCAEEERRHPDDYQLAADTELAAVRAGNRNFSSAGPAKTGGSSDEYA